MTSLLDILAKFQECEDQEIPLPSETRESLQEKIDDYHAVLTNVEALKARAQDEIDRLDARVDALDSKIDAIKRHLVYSMETFGWEKISGKNVNVSLRKSESIEINNGVDFADPRFSAFVRKKVAMSWDKLEIKKAMKEGEDLNELARVKVSKNVNFK